ncbi:hypothetical protein [Spirosoma pulveris]
MHPVSRNPTSELKADPVETSGLSTVPTHDSHFVRFTQRPQGLMARHEPLHPCPRWAEMLSFGGEQPVARQAANAER